MSQELKEVENKTAEEILKWVLKTYGGKVALASSFGLEDVALIDMMVKIDPDPQVFTLDTGRLPQETYLLMEKIREKYDLKIKVYYPNTQRVEEIVSSYGPNLFYQSLDLRKLCCEVRKVEPLKRALTGLSAWITGLRREQGTTRTKLKKTEIDQTNGGLLKINPLADWAEAQVWSYVKENKVPYNPLHEQGYPSIGCEPCTRAIKPGEDIRAGRWWWENPEEKECGLHEKPVKSGKNG